MFPGFLFVFVVFEFISSGCEFFVRKLKKST